MVRQRSKSGLNITGTAGPDDVYLVRYFLFRSNLFSIYIHRFLRSDRDDPHDHPFSFVSYLVSGEYTEVRYKYNKHPQQFDMSVCCREAGSLAYRKGEEIHMIALEQERNLTEKLQAPLTVVFRGPYYRPWGFWKDITFAPEWVIWHKYLNVKKVSRE